MESAGSMLKEMPLVHSSVVDCDVSIENEQKIRQGKVTNTSPAKYGIFSTKRVHEFLQCPVCTSMRYPPILQCPNGHTLFSTCNLRVNNHCPNCFQELDNIRFLALERIAESLELPCRHQSLGCHEILPYYKKLSHEYQCRFRPYNCPYARSECSVTGDISTLVVHLKEDHWVDMHVGCTFNHRYVNFNPLEVESATWMLTMFHCFGKHFCLHFEACKLGTAPMYMAFLRFMGVEDETRYFRYIMEVNENGRKLIWQGVPRSICNSHRRVCESQDELNIPRKLALFLSDGHQQELKLRVTGSIWKEQ